jgi:hypothetical protein
MNDMLRRDFLKTATPTAVLTATLPVQANETRATPNANFAGVNGQHILACMAPQAASCGYIGPTGLERPVSEMAQAGHG